MNGKGDSPRNCFSKAYKSNYDTINWGRSKNSFKSIFVEDREEKNRKKRIKKFNANKELTEAECEHCSRIYCDCENKY